MYNISHSTKGVKYINYPFCGKFCFRHCLKHQFLCHQVEVKSKSWRRENLSENSMASVFSCSLFYGSTKIVIQRIPERYRHLKIMIEINFILCSQHSNSTLELLGESKTSFQILASSYLILMLKAPALAWFRLLKAEVHSSFITTTVWDQSSRSHHKDTIYYYDFRSTQDYYA